MSHHTHTPRTPAQPGSKPHAQHPGLVPPAHMRRELDAGYIVFLVVVFAAFGAMLLVHYSTPCDAGTVCMGIAAAPWGRRARALLQGDPPELACTPKGAREVPAEIETSLHTPLRHALRTAWHSGYDYGERTGHVTGWRHGLRLGLFLGVYIGTPLVLLGYWGGRWVLQALGWMA